MLVILPVRTPEDLHCVNSLFKDYAASLDVNLAYRSSLRGGFEGKQFFFEKKNQKTFDIMARASGKTGDSDMQTGGLGGQALLPQSCVDLEGLCSLSALSGFDTYVATR